MEIKVKDIDENIITSAVGVIEQVDIDGVGVENCVDVNIDSKITLHITHSPDGYIVDLYKYHTKAELDDCDHDFDSDWIESVSITNEEL